MQIEAINLFILIVLAGVYLVIIKIFVFGKKPREVGSCPFICKFRDRIDFFDFARGLAILAVIVIHVAFFIRFFDEKISFSSLVWNEQINRVARFAVPVFLISSGALLSLPGLQKESLKNFYLSKIKRIIFPYAFFSFFATYLFSGVSNSFFQYLSRATKEFLTGGALPAYWFVSVLLQLYILYPFLWYIFYNKKIKANTLLLFSFVFSLVSYFFLSSHWFEWLIRPEGLPFFGGYLFFYFGNGFEANFFNKKRGIF